jgi:hypothetical protein
MGAVGLAEVGLPAGLFGSETAPSLLLSFAIMRRTSLRRQPLVSAYLWRVRGWAESWWLRDRPATTSFRHASEPIALSRAS